MAHVSYGITQFYLPPTHEPYLPLLPRSRMALIAKCQLSWEIKKLLSDLELNLLMLVFMRSAVQCCRHSIATAKLHLFKSNFNCF